MGGNAAQQNQGIKMLAAAVVVEGVEAIAVIFIAGAIFGL